MCVLMKMKMKNLQGNEQMITRNEICLSISPKSPKNQFKKRKSEKNPYWKSEIPKLIDMGKNEN